MWPVCPRKCERISCPNWIERQLAPRPREVVLVDAARVEVGRERCRDVEILAAHHRHERLGREQRLPAVIQMEVVVA
jgi:hypothetical protein